MIQREPKPGEELVIITKFMSMVNKDYLVCVEYPDGKIHTIIIPRDCIIENVAETNEVYLEQSKDYLK